MLAPFHGLFPRMGIAVVYPIRGVLHELGDDGLDPMLGSQIELPVVGLPVELSGGKENLRLELGSFDDLLGARKILEKRYVLRRGAL